MILPPVAHGVKVISIGMFVDDASDRGRLARADAAPHRSSSSSPTSSSATSTCCCSTCRPGTGDVAISVGQLLPHAEVLVVTTPAARRGRRRRAQRRRRPADRPAGHRRGREHGRARAARRLGAASCSARAAAPRPRAGCPAGQDARVPLLASVPLSVALREGGDVGAPVVVLGAGRPGGRGDRRPRGPAGRASSGPRGAEARAEPALTDPAGRTTKGTPPRRGALRRARPRRAQEETRPAGRRRPTTSG